jgi:hypothetical protein
MANTYEDVASDAGLDERTTELFVRYMRQRWAEEESLHCQVGYAAEWAERFQQRWEYEASDVVGKAVLDQMARDVARS